MKHFVIPSILTILFTFVLAFLLKGAGLSLVAASVQAGPIDGMIDLQLWIISFLFSLIVVFMLYSFFAFRNKKNQLAAGTYFTGSTRLEVAWTILPLGLIIFLSFLGARDLADIRRADPNALEVKVIAFQWGWSFQYPETGVISNELYLPVNQQVHLVMTSKDVIHSFWVPEFRVKQDILPGDNLVKDLRLTPTRIGQYTVMCNELCGGAHAYMNAPVKVVSAQDFDAWLAEKGKASTASPVDRGAAQAKSSGCLACHSADGTKMVGPTWKGLAGEQIKLTDGSTVAADDAYLRDSIVDPNKHVVAGYAPVMPQTYKDLLSDQQIEDLIAYMKTLK